MTTKAERVARDARIEAKTHEELVEEVKMLRNEVKGWMGRSVLQHAEDQTRIEELTHHLKEAHEAIESLREGHPLGHITGIQTIRNMTQGLEGYISLIRECRPLTWVLSDDGQAASKWENKAIKMIIVNRPVGGLHDSIGADTDSSDMAGHRISGDRSVQ